MVPFCSSISSISVTISFSISSVSIMLALVAPPCVLIAVRLECAQLESRTCPTGRRCCLILGTMKARTEQVETMRIPKESR